FVSQCASRPRNSSVIARSASSERDSISGSKDASSGTIVSTSLSFRPSPACRSLLKRPMLPPSVPTAVVTALRQAAKGGRRRRPRTPAPSCEHAARDDGRRARLGAPDLFGTAEKRETVGADLAGGRGVRRRHRAGAVVDGRGVGGPAAARRGRHG